jgi:hypothetical protein
MNTILSISNLFTRALFFVYGENLKAVFVQIHGDLDSPVQVGSDTMTAFIRNDIY